MLFTQVKNYFHKLKQADYKHIFQKLSILAILIYVLYGGMSHLFRYNEFSQRYQSMQKELSSEILKKQRFETQIQRFDSDQYWEWLARRRLGKVQAGEQVYKIRQ